jgi:hypothetical protein
MSAGGEGTREGELRAPQAGAAAGDLHARPLPPGGLLKREKKVKNRWEPPIT